MRRADTIPPGGWLPLLALLLTAPGVVRGGDPRPPRGGMFLVAADDCGSPGNQPRLTRGGSWTLTDQEKEGLAIGDDRYRTMAYDGNAVALRYAGLRPDATYTLRVHYFNVSHDRTVRLDADDLELHDSLALPQGRPVVRVIDLPRDTYRDASVTVTCSKVTGGGAIVSAVELWSDREGLLPTGTFVRFHVDALPPDKAELAVTAQMKIHASPWVTPSFSLTPKEGVRQPGPTPWVNLAGLPGQGRGSLILTVPAGARGATEFSLVEIEGAGVRKIRWDEPDGNRIVVEPTLADVLTFREQERRYYHTALQATGERLHPLTRPPLMFSNAWGYTTGGAAEYMVKTFRLLGFNSVVTSADQGRYEKLYGWHSQGAQYGPPGFMPYDDDASRSQFAEHYAAYFATGGGRNTTPEMRIFQLADEPGEAPIKDSPEARAGFHRWLTAEGVAPSLFGKKAWDEVGFLLGTPGTAEEKRLHYWSRRYQAYLTPRLFALASDAVREQSPAKAVLSYVALSGHAMNFPSKQPLDMFQLAQYPGLMPGISDWMTNGNWWWDGHQSVAYSVAPFNAGARRYGKDADQPPISFPMMHCVYPSLLRATTQLANNCKLISYYNYGPDYEVTEGFWSSVGWHHEVVGLVNNRAARVDDILGPGTMRRSRVAMLYTAPQEIWWPQGTFTDKRASFLSMAHDYYQPELVSEEHVRAGALADYDALFVLDHFVSRDVQHRIENWVKGGGLLWACADAAVLDEYNERYDLLDRLAELKRDHSVSQTAETSFVPVADETALPAHPVPPLGRSREAIRPGVFTAWPGARIRAHYGDGKPAWAQKEVGKGTVVYCGHRAGLSASCRAGKRGELALWPDGRQLLTAPLLEAGVRRELWLSEPFCVATPISTAHGTVAILYDLNATPPNDLTVTLLEPARPHSVQAFDEQGNLADVPFEYSDGAVRVRLAAVPWMGQMIVVRRGPAPADDRIAVMRGTAEEGLRADDWQALSAAAWFAGFHPEWQFAPRLVPLLKHEHWAVRRSAAESLGRLRHAAAGGPLRAALDRETDAHALADQLLALARLNHEDAKTLCKRFRTHADPFVCREAVRAEALLVAAGEHR